MDNADLDRLAMHAMRATISVYDDKKNYTAFDESGIELASFAVIQDTDKANIRAIMTLKNHDIIMHDMTIRLEPFQFTKQLVSGLLSKYRARKEQ